VWKDVDLLERLLNSIRAKTEGVFEVIVSESETPEVYKMEGFKVVSTPPQGHNIAVEKGLEVASGEYLMWVDVDVIVSKDWWKKIRRIFETDERVGLVSPLQYPRWDQWVLTLHRVPPHLLKPELIDSEEMLRMVETREPEWFELGENMPAEICPVYYGYPKSALLIWDYAFEGFTVMRRECYEEVGAYAENPSRGTEVNISRNAGKKGWKVVCANRVHYWHCDSYPECLGFGRAFRRRGGRFEAI